MYEVICTTYSPDTQVSIRENTNTVNETVWLCRAYFALIRKIPPKTLKIISEKRFTANLL